ncbi:MAG: bifunctional diaminohydroxyphosphoribosylaminopyrimidine deaminase/5-amino-6-(5-phosphoribosylamino)uracil reductase RibD [Candidatus Micrarchaeota archaeon]|nr:bifunctional diaminohydroxyphosphoribosylaminopyrimidine deaminase/5-amino-6-(5-phosphoribosylamino)uracil reductase RibD [Candidatus Micrarchaeota archaeon]
MVVDQETSKNVVTLYSKYMKKAIKLARTTNPFPNPRVGCLIFDENGKIISQAYHEMKGRDHAEIIAIRKAKEIKQDLSKCTLVTTLEPCTEFEGKCTKSCTAEIINSGIKTVVIGCIDPLEKIRGIEYLKSKNINVVQEVMKHEASDLIKEYAVFIKYKRPFIALKCGISIDGKLATDNGVSKWINSQSMREYSNSLRGLFDSILVGINTLLNDDPLLTQRYGNIIKQPDCIVVDSSLKTPCNAKIFSEKRRRIFIITDKNNKVQKLDRINELEENNAIMIYTDKIYDKHTNGYVLDLKPALQILASDFNVSSVAVEGGSQIHSYFLQNNLFDELYVYIAGKIIGGTKYRLCNYPICLDALTNCLKLKLKRIKKIDDDVLLLYQNVH